MINSLENLNFKMDTQVEMMKKVLNFLTKSSVGFSIQSYNFEFPLTSLEDLDKFESSLSQKEWNQSPHRRRDKCSNPNKQRRKSNPLFHSCFSQKSTGVSKSLPLDHVDEVARAETRKARRVCCHLR